jgi:hypothetical protein
MYLFHLRHAVYLMALRKERLAQEHMSRVSLSTSRGVGVMDEDVHGDCSEDSSFEGNESGQPDSDKDEEKAAHHVSADDERADDSRGSDKDEEKAAHHVSADGERVDDSRGSDKDEEKTAHHVSADGERVDDSRGSDKDEVEVYCGDEDDEGVDGDDEDDGESDMNSNVRTSAECGRMMKVRQTEEEE